MRLLMTTDTIGGVWTFTQELSTGLLALGSDIALVSLGRALNSKQQQWVDMMTDTWATRFHFEALTTSLEWMPDNEDAFAAPAEALLRLATDFQADLLHLNQFCFGALRTTLPKVVTAHSDVLTWARHCRSGHLDDSAWLRRYRALVSSGLREAGVVTAPTHWMMRELADFFDLPPDQFAIPNGRSIPAASPINRKLQAITAGRLWDEAKNISVLSRVSSPIPLLVAGSSKLGVAADPMAAVTPASSVSLLGELGSDDLFAHFRESALYICTSIYEPFGLAPLEAALCGCAILANDIPSLREVWGDGALYFHDAASLSSLLATLAEDDQFVAVAQVRSLARALTYTREALAASYLQVFLSAIEASQREAVAHAA